MRYIFDTNVFVSVLLFKNSNPAKAFYYVLKNEEILLSFELLDELNEVLSRQKFNRYVTMEERQEFVTTLIQRATLIEIVDEVQECRDPKDNKILELALSGKAQYIISGDKDLLIMNPFRGIKIITVDEFLRNINEG
jgi:uncharacterized protein